jgi:hypothetical protein
MQFSENVIKFPSRNILLFCLLGFYLNGFGDRFGLLQDTFWLFHHIPLRFKKVVLTKERIGRE